MAATSQADSASKMQIAWPVGGRKNPPRYLTSRSAVLAPRAALARAFWVLERGVCAVGVGDPVAGQVGRVHVSEQRARGVHVGKDEGRVPRAGLCRGLTEASVSVSSSADPGVFGQPVTVTATVTAAAGQPVPAGTVQFAVDGQDLGSPVTLSGGSVTSDPTASLAVGHHAVTATYTPADGSAPSSGTLTPDQNIQQGATTTTLTSSPNPSQPGQTVTYTATVARPPRRPAPPPAPSAWCQARWARPPVMSLPTLADTANDDPAQITHDLPAQRRFPYPRARRPADRPHHRPASMSPSAIRPAPGTSTDPPSCTATR